MNDYPWSKVTKKLVTLLEKALAYNVQSEDLWIIEENVIDYRLENIDSGPVIDFLSILTSGIEHPECVLVTGNPIELDNTLIVIKELAEELTLELKLYDHGEWLIWHLPKLGYGVFLEREAITPYYWTSKELLEVNAQDLILNRSIKK